MKRLLIGLAITTLLVGACDQSAAVPDSFQAGPGERVTLSETLHFDAIPQFAVPYGSGSDLTLRNLELTERDGTISGKVDFDRTSQVGFTLVVYLSMADELLVGYLDQDADLTIDLPGGTVLFGISGYELTGDESGSLQFSLNARVFNGYDVADAQGTVYVFAVPGEVHPQGTLPGDQTDVTTYQANSNILVDEFDF